MILVVDDNPEHLQLYRINLKSEAVYADCSQQAVKMLATGNISLLITDYSMPFMDGVTLARLAKSKYKIPVIIVSGVADVGGMMGLNCDLLLIKPIDYQGLKESIKQILRS